MCAVGTWISSPSVTPLFHIAPCGRRAERYLTREENGTLERWIRVGSLREIIQANMVSRVGQLPFPVH